MIGDKKVQPIHIRRPVKSGEGGFKKEAKGGQGPQKLGGKKRGNNRVSKKEGKGIWQSTIG